MDIPVEPDRVQTPVPDGVHQGAIVAADENRQNHHGRDIVYLDLTLTVGDVADERGQLAEVKVGYPVPATPSSMLGQLLQRFNIQVTPGQTVNSRQLVGRICTYQTITKPSRRDPTRQYSEVIRDSLKPYPPTVPFLTHQKTGGGVQPPATQGGAP